MVKQGIQLDTSEVKEFCSKWKICELSVFGSILREDFRPDSEVDLLVQHEEDANWDLFDQIHMQDELTALIGRDLYILDQEGVESSNDHFLRTEIFTTLEQVYAARYIFAG